MNNKRRTLLSKFRDQINQVADELLGELEEERDETACQHIEAAEGMLRDAVDELESAEGAA